MGASEEMEVDAQDVEIVDVEKDAKAWVPKNIANKSYETKTKKVKNESQVA